MTQLPKSVDHIQVPPIKCQGIKSDLVDFIAMNIDWDGEGRWIEPFLGSGVVPFNIEPEKALLADANPHIIEFYQGVYEGEITGQSVRNFLEKHGQLLEEQGEDHYYEMRDRFNEDGGPLRLLFLNRSCYNGMMRFNSSGGYNVPFCKKPNRFTNRSGAYITKIENQVNEIAKIMEGKDWEFQAWNWKETLENTRESDFVYLDPPYIGRNTGYIGEWKDHEAEELAEMTQELDAGYALSMWANNKYRENEHIEEYWSDNALRSYEHFYYVGSTEDLRNEMNEALVIREGYETPEQKVEDLKGEYMKQTTLGDLPN